MCELIAVFTLGRMARDRVYHWMYAVLGPAYAWGAALAAILLWIGVDELGLTLSFPFPVVAYALGYLAAYLQIRRLPWKDRPADSGGLAQRPACDSSQTEVVGGMIQCFNCEQISDAPKPY